jgi:magnesium chelatase subunit I
VSNCETLVANATRRALRNGERDVVPRVSDLDALAASTAGKVEIESLDDRRDEHVVEQQVKSAVHTTNRERFGRDRLRDVLAAFEGGSIVHTGDDIASSDYVELVRDMPGLRAPVSELTGGDERPSSVAAAVEFVLEGAHLSKWLNKDSLGSRATYRGRG